MVGPVRSNGNGKSLTPWGGPPPAPPHVAPHSGSFAGGMEAELRTYMDILRRRGRWIAGVFAAVVAVALVVTLVRKPVYRSSALLEIRADVGDTPSMDGLFAGRDPSDADLRTHFGLLRSAALASRVIQDLRLDTLQEFAPDDSTRAQAVVEGFLDRLVVDPIEESRLVKVSFDAGSPELSARIVNTIVKDYSSMRVDERLDAAQRLALQLDSVQVKLEGSENELKAYAEANNLPYLVDEDPTAQASTRLTDLRARLTEAQEARYEQESLYKAVVEEGRVDLLDSKVLDDLKIRRGELQRDYARLSATFTDDYPATAEVRRQIENVQELIQKEQESQARRVESDYQLAREREQKIAAAIDSEEHTASEVGLQSGKYHLLRQAVLSNRELYTNLHERQREAEVAAAIGPTDLTVVDAAVAPGSPHRPVFAMNMALAMMLGLLLGVGTAFGRELLDDTVRTAEDLPIPMGVPILAMIPSLEAAAMDRIRAGARGLLAGPGTRVDSRNGDRVAHANGNGKWPRIDTVDRRNPEGIAIVDAFGALRTAVLSRKDAPLPRLVLVSSCRAGEGKTTISLNLAMSLTKLVNRVLLIDGDLRKPAVHRALGIEQGPGLLGCLRGEVSFQDAVQRSVAPGLDALPAGGVTTSAGDLLAGKRLGQVMREAEAQYDFVIVDAPALFINASDATLLANEVDGVVVVTRSRSTPRALVERIPLLVPNLIGLVVNDLQKSSLPGYFGEYFADYGETVEVGSSDTGWG